MEKAKADVVDEEEHSDADSIDIEDDDNTSETSSRLSSTLSSSGSDLSSDSSGEYVNLDSHIDQLTTEVMINMAEKAGAVINLETAEELKTNVMDRLRNVVMVALQFSHHENSPGLTFRDFEKAEDAVLDPSGTRKMYAPKKKSEETIDLLKTVSHDKFSIMPIQNLNPRFKMHLPNHFRYIPTESDQECEICFTNNACKFEETDQFLVTGEDLKCFSSEDEVEDENSGDQDFQDAIDDGGRCIEEQQPEELVVSDISTDGSNENQLSDDDFQFGEQNVEEELHNIDNGEKLETILETEIPDYTSNIAENYESSGIGSNAAEIPENKYLEQEKMSVDEHQNSELITTDLNESGSSEKFVVDEYVDEDGNSYLVTRESTNTEGYISDSIVIANDNLQQEKGESTDIVLQNEQNVFEYSEPATNVCPENLERCSGYVNFEEALSPNSDIISEEPVPEPQLVHLPQQSDSDEEDITDVEEVEGNVEEIELESSDEEIEMLNSEEEIELENSEDEIELKDFEEDIGYDCASECLEEEIDLENPDEIEWGESGEVEVQLRITDNTEIATEATEIGAEDEDCWESEYEISEDEIEIGNSNEDVLLKNSEEYIGLARHIGDRKVLSEVDKIDESKLSCNQDDKMVEYVYVDVELINGDGNLESLDCFDYQEYNDNEVTFEYIDIDQKNPKNTVNLGDRGLFQGVPLANHGENFNTLDFYDYQDEETYKTTTPSSSERIRVQEMPEVEVEFNYNSSNNHLDCVESHANTALEFPDTEVELVDSDAEVQLSDSDAEIQLSDESSSDVDVANSEDSRDSGGGNSGSGEGNELSDDELSWANSQKYQPEKCERRQNNEYTQSQDFVIFDNPVECIQYQINYETLKLDVENIGVTEPEPLPKKGNTDIPPPPTEGLQETKSDEKKSDALAPPISIEATTVNQSTSVPINTSVPVEQIKKEKSNNSDVPPTTIREPDLQIDPEALIMDSPPELDDVYVIEFQDVDEAIVFNDNDTIKASSVWFSIDDQNSTVEFAHSESADITQYESIDVAVTISESSNGILVSEPRDKVLSQEGVSDECKDVALFVKIDESDSAMASNSGSEQAGYDGNSDSDVSPTTTVEEITSTANSESETTSPEDYYEQDYIEGERIDPGVVTSADLYPEGDSIKMEISEMELQYTTSGQELLSEQLGTQDLETLVEQTTDYSQRNFDLQQCDMPQESKFESIHNLLEDVKEEDLNDSANNSTEHVSVDDALKRKPGDHDLQLIKMASECLEDSSSGSDEPESEEDGEVLDLANEMFHSKSHIAVMKMSNQHPILPEEWREYMKTFVCNFFRNTDIETDEVDSEEFDIMLRDVRKHGVFPVLDIICDFFCDYIRQQSEQLEYGEVLTMETETSLSMISATMKSVLDCPLDISQLHLEMISSVLIDLLTLPTPCKNQQCLIQSFLKVILQYESLLDWTKKYITETLKEMLPSPLENLGEESKSLLGGAVALANGLETIGIHAALENSWQKDLLVFCEKYAILMSSPNTHKLFSENDTYIEHEIFIFFKTFCMQYTQVPRVYALCLRSIVNQVYGERITMYLDISEDLNSPATKNNCPKSAEGSNGAHSSCNVCTKPDKSKYTNTKLFSKLPNRTGVKKKHKVGSGSVMSLTVML